MNLTFKKITMIKKMIFASLAIGLLATSCSSDDDASTPAVVIPTSTLTLNFNGLGNLGDNLVYEGWIMVDGAPQTTGTFTVNDAGVASKTTFDIPTEDLDAATAFVLSLEPASDSDPLPSETKILSGTFAANAASLVINDQVGVFNSTTLPFSGSFITATPTDNTGGVNNGNDDMGVWFLDMPGPVPSLVNLPALSTGWKYEGWVVFNNGTEDVPLSMGKFTSASGVDSASPYSGNEPAPAFPGEDFLSFLPAGIDGVVTGRPVVISIEPDVEGTNDTTPFFFKPISGTEGVDSNAVSLVDNINVTVTGTATR
jgi:hypothetical protein